jgi:hypothetical protein
MDAFRPLSRQYSPVNPDDPRTNRDLHITTLWVDKMVAVVCYQELGRGEAQYATCRGGEANEAGGVQFFSPWRKGCQAGSSNFGGYIEGRGGCWEENDRLEGSCGKGSRDRKTQGYQTVRIYEGVLSGLARR